MIAENNQILKLNRIIVITRKLHFVLLRFLQSMFVQYGIMGGALKLLIFGLIPTLENIGDGCKEISEFLCAILFMFLV